MIRPRRNFTRFSMRLTARIRTPGQCARGNDGIPCCRSENGKGENGKGVKIGKRLKDWKSGQEQLIKLVPDTFLTPILPMTPFLPTPFLPNKNHPKRRFRQDTERQPDPGTGSIEPRRPVYRLSFQTLVSSCRSGEIRWRAAGGWSWWIRLCMSYSRPRPERSTSAPAGRRQNPGPLPCGSPVRPCTA